MPTKGTIWVNAIISLIMALISYFVSRKSGASDSKAAMIAAGAGLGTYYVTTQTDWGQSASQWVSEKWATLTGSDGVAVKNKDGSTATAPAGAAPVLDANGNQTYDANGNAIFKLADSAIKTTGQVLSSWGGPGTATVIGTAGLVASSNLQKYWPYGLAFLALFLVVK